MNEKLPDGYSLKKFGELFSFEKKSNKKASEGKEDGLYKFFTSSNIQSRYIDDFDFGGERLIFGTGGNASIHYVNDRFSTSTDCLIAKEKEDLILVKYVYYYLRCKIYLLEAGFKGAGLKHISKEYIQKISIVYPKDKRIQKLIVSILEKAEETKRLRAQADELTQQLLKSVFLEMFGDPRTNPYKWGFRKIKDISEKFSDGPFGSNLKSEHYKPDGIRVIRLQNIGVCNFIDDDKAFISEEHFSTLKRHTCFPRDVIIGTMGSPNLRACMLPDSIQIALNKADCIQCRPDENIALSEYICYLLNLPSTLQMASNMIHGQTRSRISMGNLSMLKIPIPPIELQRNYAAIVQKLNFTKQYQQQSSQQINILFDSLMQKAFTGELVS